MRERQGGEDWKLNGERSPMCSENELGKENNGNGHFLMDDAIENDIVIQPTKIKSLIYGVSETPPVHLTILFALQQCLISINTSLAVSLLVSEVVCARHDDVVKTQVLSSTMMMAGVATFMMSTFGIRLPIFQGPTVIYIINLAALSDNTEWSCPRTFQADGFDGNATGVMMADLGNGTSIPLRSLIYDKIGQISGSLIAAGAVHFLIAATGLVGVLTRFIGPLTIVPAIVLVGLNIYTVTVKFSETSWLAASITTMSCLTFSLVLSNRKTPIPFWNKQTGFHVTWYPLHQTLAILLSSLIGWAFSGIMTTAGAFSDDRESPEFLARTDARIDVIGQTPWFTLPYPGRFGSFSFSSSAFINFMIITFLSIMDSIGDYSATARVARVTPPPKYAFNRGIAVEGLMTMLGGAMGCCHGTVSHGEPIGIMGITRVTSRRVFQVTALLYVMFACLGKLGAAFITIPYSVLGGTQIACIGIFIGVVLSYLKMVNLNSTRNMSVVGISLLLGLMLPYWVKKHPDEINTGSTDLDVVLTMFMSNPSFVGGVFACIMDNVFPGSRKERGLDLEKQLLEGEAMSVLSDYEEGPEVYRLPVVGKYLTKSSVARWLPFCE